MWVLSRLVSSLLVLLMVSMMLFALCRATPVSPARLSLGVDASAEQVAEFERQYGLDLPVLVQYGRWISSAARLELGDSYVSGSPIAPQIRQTLPFTVELVTLSFLATVLLSVLLGVTAALHEDRVADHLLRLVAIVGLSIPGFWLALLLVRYAAVGLGLFPPGGIAPISDGIGPHLRSLVLPVFCISFYYVSVLSRLVRTNMIDALSQDYIRTAEAMGLTRRRVWLYALKNALPPLASMAAMVYGYMFGWALIVEQVFNIPGISRELLSAIFSRDYPTVQAIVLVITIIFIASNTAADILQRALSPKLGGESLMNAIVFRRPARQFGARAAWRFLRAITATPIGAIGLVLVGLLATAALLAPVLPIKDPLWLYLEHRLEAPGEEFIFGTDQAGRDIFSRVIWGARASLSMGVCVVAIGLALGVSIGLVAGYFSRTWIEEGLMKLMEVLASIPLLIWAIAMVGVLGVQPSVIGPFSLSNEVKLTLLIGLLYTPGLARLTHGLVLNEAQAEYVLARRVQGASTAAILFSDVLPNVISPVLVQATLLLGVAIIVEASLSFIGLGVQPPTPSWGSLLSDARNLIFSGEWWVSLFPGATVFAAVLGLNLLGDAMRVVLDPRRRNAGKVVA